jgi:ABC-type transport system substrate-binding protein
MAEVPYHKAADPEVQASGLPGNDRTNHEAMLAYVKASESDDPTDRLPFWGENVVLDDWLVPGEKLVGRDEVLGAAWEGLPGSPLDALTEVRAEIHQTIISGNILVTMGHFTARFVKDVKWSPGAKPIPATGEKVRWSFRDVYHFEDGKIVRVHYANDTLTVARQLGVFPDDGYPW